MKESTTELEPGKAPRSVRLTVELDCRNHVKNIGRGGKNFSGNISWHGGAHPCFGAAFTLTGEWR